MSRSKQLASQAFPKASEAEADGIEGVGLHPVRLKMKSHKAFWAKWLKMHNLPFSVFSNALSVLSKSGSIAYPTGFSGAK